MGGDDWVDEEGRSLFTFVTREGVGEGVSVGRGMF